MSQENVEATARTPISIARGAPESRRRSRRNRRVGDAVGDRSAFPSVLERCPIAPRRQGCTPKSPGYAKRFWLYRRKGRDSNPRDGSSPLTVFKTAAFNRSATLPRAPLARSAVRSPSSDSNQESWRPSSAVARIRPETPGPESPSARPADCFVPLEPARGRLYTLAPDPGRGGRVAEGTRLLSEYGGHSIAGSNPALSVSSEI